MWDHIKKSVVVRQGCVQLCMHYEHVQVCEDGTEKRVRCVRHGGAFKRHSSWNIVMEVSPIKELILLKVHSMTVYTVNYAIWIKDRTVYVLWCTCTYSCGYY